jgi:hypothetical protein
MAMSVGTLALDVGNKSLNLKRLYESEIDCSLFNDAFSVTRIK